MNQYKDLFTRDLRIGDFITCYNAGIHRVTKIERRFRGPRDVGRYSHSGAKIKDGEEYHAYISYTRVLDASLKPASKTKKGCDASFCTKIDANYIEEQRKDFDRRMQVLKDLLLPENEKRDYCPDCKAAYRKVEGCRVCDQCGSYGPAVGAKLP